MSGKKADDGARALSGKEKKEFDNVVRCYETKQHKKGLKSADFVLKKFPNHGETLAMKGLILSNMDRMEEAHELVKLGVRNDMKSHVCWHVYGLVHRADRNYREAIKCYRMALKLDEGNSQILRDLASLQIQVRDLADFTETRRIILKDRAGARQNWMGLAVAKFLQGQHRAAVAVIEKYEDFRAEERGSEPNLAKYEVSEMYLFKAMILEEAGAHEEALAVLDKHSDKLVDVIGVLEQRARLYTALGRGAQAEATLRALIAKNTENHGYYRQLEAVLGVDGDVAELEATYDALAVRYPKSDAVRRLPLDFLSGDAFAGAVRKYVVGPIRKGVPSLFRNLKSLYADRAKAAVMGEAFAEVVTSLESSGKFPGSDESESDVAQCLCHARTLLAHHNDKVGDAEGALRTIDSAIASTEPRVLECYLAKASFLKHAGDVVGAMNVANEVREMDKADRYLNSYCVKRMLRAGEYETAERTVALFTRDGNQASNLFDMQCAWFENEAGRCHQRGGRKNRALKYFTAVRKHYDDMEEDQFDFHQYCLRKNTLRHYVQMLRVEDTLYSRRAYREAARGGVEVYLDLFDDPLPDPAEEEEKMLAGMSKEERQAYRKKLKKAEEKKAKEDAEKKAREEKEAREAEKDGKKKNQVRRKEDPDPNGDALLRTKTPLVEAERLLEPLLRHAADFEDTHLLAFEVFVRKGKLLLALRACNAAVRCSPSSFAARRNVARLAALVASAVDASTSLAVRTVLDDGVGALTGGATAMAYARALVAEARSSLEGALAAEAVKLAGGDAAAAAAKVGDSEVPRSVDDAAAAVAALERVGAGADALKAKLAVAFPYCEAFGGAKATKRA
mmetsp:Transcript_13670/g.57854  ORF Transcript_13670/g.57854 Transcript_13670/m.57854 type:complete len:849 (-) Transcript_13670:900-3446(-)